MKTFLEFFYHDAVPDMTNLELYHGSNVVFDEFDFKKFGQTDSGTMGPGFYLTGKPEVALQYAENATRYRQFGEPHVLVFRVNPRRTLVLHSNNVSVWEDKMRELDIPPGTVHENARALMGMGYDSVVSLDDTMIVEMVLYKSGIAVRTGEA